MYQEQIIDNQEDILYIDDNLLINNIQILKINHNININDTNVDMVIHKINHFMNKLDNDEQFIILIDFNELDHDISILKLKKIIKYVENTYIKRLYKCIIYNYTNTWKIILDIIMSFISQETKDIICLKKNIDFN